MTPKEKADKFVKKMYAVHSNSASDITLYFAKQCALIAVDEIINSIVIFDLTAAENQFTYWEQVKQEIEKL